MSWKRILATGLLTISMVACASQQPMTKPTKPTLNVQVQPDGGMCLNREDTAKLGAYILELEMQ